jgi:hypothetical protein
MNNCECGKCKDKAPCGKYWCECECYMLGEEIEK